ncbi:MAG: cellulase family glycosylhydrolase, partial [Planctomycetota bacterium]
MSGRALVCAGFLALWIGGGTKAEEPLFPFVISYDAPENVTNVSGWLERPAGRSGFVLAQEDRLVTDAGPIRFWATNLCFEACFPDREQADRLAARLARLGFNCVRMHHMDSRSIWGESPDKLTIDPEKLDRLDYLIHQLKQNGIYTNINLHVSRWFGEAEGFAGRDQRPDYDKGLDNFEPRMIELQKKYARDLLTHVNPYTKTAYTQEPAVAFVEISNEDALFTVWGWGQIDRLPDPYATTFRELWNEWLRKKYGDTEKLRKAWNVGEWPLGNEMLANGDFSQPPQGSWNLERDDQTEVEWSVREDGPEGASSLRVVVGKQGRVSWHPQINQSG